MAARGCEKEAGGKETGKRGSGFWFSVSRVSWVLVISLFSGFGNRAQATSQRHQAHNCSQISGGQRQSTRKFVEGKAKSYAAS